ncbi:MAG: diphosphomevalonate decarboxylase [Crocinitomicaceae bacterium]|nr:diphosphomevalonate decarboxylase [Crocinitomicaceae bacterium]
MNIATQIESFRNEGLRFNNIPSGELVCHSPSNIALVKYWGKIDAQIPCNPSVSFTLNNAISKTKLNYQPSESGKFELEFLFENQRNPKFEEKIMKFFQSISEVFPFINQLKFSFESENTFPHSAGIASSASGMSAIAMILCELEKQHFGTLQEKEEYLQKASFIARLGSGSACRSVYPELASWGEIKGYDNTSNLYATQMNAEVDNVFATYHDDILIVDKKEKSVSSRAGHDLMNGNPYAEPRFQQGKENVVKIIDIMKAGDLDAFNSIVESEALTLHAMMMTSNPYFLLMRPNTVKIIEKIFAYRNDTKLPVCFTLDAGPNIHLLYPDSIKMEIKTFIEAELRPLTYENTIIEDHVGQGSKII